MRDKNHGLCAVCGKFVKENDYTHVCKTNSQIMNCDKPQFTDEMTMMLARDLLVYRFDGMQDTIELAKEFQRVWNEDKKI